jgi:hypothetical protein
VSNNRKYSVDLIIYQGTSDESNLYWLEICSKKFAMRIITFTCVITLLLFSCKKNKERLPFIIMGDQTDMLYTKYFKLIDGTFYNPEYFDIDLDKNGVMDLRLSRGPNTTGNGTIPEARIESLHSSCKVRVETMMDTTFIHDISIFSVDPQGNDVHIHSITYSCRMESPDYTIDTVQVKTELVATAINEYISLNDAYLDVSMPFQGSNSSTYEPTGYVFQGLTYYDLTTHYNDCSAFPKSQETYIGVKLYTSDGIRLGWVRINLNSNSKIMVKDWAIQL